MDEASCCWWITICSYCDVTVVGILTPELKRRKVIILALFFSLNGTESQFLSLNVSVKFLHFDLSMVNVLYINVLITKTYYICLGSVKNYFKNLVPLFVTLGIVLSS